MDRKKWMVRALAVMAVLLISGQALGQELTVEGHLLGVSTNDEGYIGVMGDRGSAGTGVLVGYELEQVEDLRLVATFGSDGQTGRRFGGDLESQFSRTRVMVGADYGPGFFHGRVRPLGRVTMGYAGQSLVLEADGESYRDQAHGFSAFAGAGVELAIGSGPVDRENFWSRLSVGGSFLMGYLWQSSARFDEMSSTTAPAEPTEEDPWIRGSYDAGTMQMSGLAWTLGAVIRYRFGK